MSAPHMNPRQQAGRVIRDFRYPARQEDFAASLGIDQSTLSRIESGQALPTTPVAMTLLRMVRERNPAQASQLEEAWSGPTPTPAEATS